MYDNARIETLYLGSITFTTSDKVFAIPVSDDERCRIVDVKARVTTTFAGATTTPVIRIGSSGDDDEFFEWDMGTEAAANLMIRAQIDAPTAWIEDANERRVEPDRGEDVYITCAAATGVGAAGVADVWVTVAIG